MTSAQLLRLEFPEEIGVVGTVKFEARIKELVTVHCYGVDVAHGRGGMRTASQVQAVVLIFF